MFWSRQEPPYKSKVILLLSVVDSKLWLVLSYCLFPHARMLQITKLGKLQYFSRYLHHQSFMRKWSAVLEILGNLAPLQQLLLNNSANLCNDINTFRLLILIYYTNLSKFRVLKFQNIHAWDQVNSLHKLEFLVIPS